MNPHPNLSSLTRTEYRTLIRGLREARRADTLAHATMPILSSTWRMRNFAEGHESRAIRALPGEYRPLVDLFRNRYVRFQTARAVRIAAKAESVRKRRHTARVLADAIARSRAYAASLEAA